MGGDLAGSPAARTSFFHCKGHGFDLWLGNQGPACCVVWPKRKKEGWREGYGIGWWEGGVLHSLPGSWPLRGVQSMLRRACQVGMW